VSCAHPIDVDRLVAWWLGETAGPDEAALEEHLLGCAHCSARLETVAALAEGVRAAVRSGKVTAVVSEPFVRAMKQAGMRLREYAVEPGGSVHCTIRAGDDAVVSRLRAPLSGVERLDVVRTRSEGATEERVADVPFDPDTGEVLVIPSASWLKTMPAFTMHMRLVAVGKGGESEIGEYTFLHSPG